MAVSLTDLSVSRLGLGITDGDIGQEDVAAQP